MGTAAAALQGWWAHSYRPGCVASLQCCRWRLVRLQAVGFYVCHRTVYVVVDDIWEVFLKKNLTSKHVKVSALALTQSAWGPKALIRAPTDGAAILWWYLMVNSSLQLSRSETYCPKQRNIFFWHQKQEILKLLLPSTLSGYHICVQCACLTANLQHYKTVFALNKHYFVASIHLNSFYPNTLTWLGKVSLSTAGTVAGPFSLPQLIHLLATLLIYCYLFLPVLLLNECLFFYFPHRAVCLCHSSLHNW